MDLIKKAKELMRKQTAKNNAPAWELTELVVSKGRGPSKMVRRPRSEQEA